MKKILLWIAERWYLVVLAVGGIFLVVWLRGRSLGDLLAKMSLELKVIEARGVVRKAQATTDAIQAKAAVEQRYRTELSRLSDEQKAEAEGLKDDPVKMAEFLVRAGSAAR
jgi:hypothetical protein